MKKLAPLFYISLLLLSPAITWAQDSLEDDDLESISRPVNPDDLQESTSDEYTENQIIIDTQEESTELSETAEVSLESLE